MANATITVTPVAGPFPLGVSWARVVDVAFVDNYRTGGVALAASDIPGATAIDFVALAGGVAPASALSTGNAISFDPVTSKFVMFEGSSAGTALSEKTDDEAVPTGQSVRALVLYH
jgi:hypothetical protein